MRPNHTHWEILPDNLQVEEYKQRKEIKKAAQWLKKGKLVAFPTETVYGLGASAIDDQAVDKIFRAKGRPADNPLIIHIGSKKELSRWVDTSSSKVSYLIERFWPGPLTLVLPHDGMIAKNVTAGLSTVGVRMPSHPVALALLQLADIPIAAPSANLSGRPSSTRATHVWDDLVDTFDLLLDAGSVELGIESTVLDMSGKVPLLLRPGGISVEMLEEVIGMVKIDPSLKRKDHIPRSPGMKYQHYAPKAKMWLIRGEENQVISYIRKQSHQCMNKGEKVGILTVEEHKEMYQADKVVICGRLSDPLSVAKSIFHALRSFDEVDVDIIFSECFSDEGLYFSIMDRLSKAANGNILELK